VSNSYKSLFFHIVWSTRGKVPFFSEQGKKRLYGYIKDIIKERKVELLAIGGTCDHIHILIRTNSLESIAGFVRHIKSSSSGFVNKVVGDKHRFQWQKGYGVFTVNSSLVNKVRRYIINQEEHHKVIGFEKELDFFVRF